MKLSIVIVNYNVRHYIVQCLDSVSRAIKTLRTEGHDADVYVVDNHSKDDSVEYLKQHCPDIHLTASIHNLGFSKANNIAIRESKGEYVLLLNPDTVIGEHTLSKIIAYADENPQMGGMGVKMLAADGTKAPESRRGLPTPMVSLYKILGLCKRFPDHPRFARYYMSNMPWDEAGEIDICSGAFLLMRCEALNKVGLLDEDFFMYGEDIDLSYRIQKGGWKNIYYPETILHYKGESTHHSSFRYVHVFYQAMLIFYRKHFRSAWWLALPVRLAIYAKAFIALIMILISWLRDVIGMRKRNKGSKINYLFIGTQESLEKCRHHAHINDLSAKFIEGTQELMPLGHHDALRNEAIETGRNTETCVVYDVSQFTYEHVLTLFANNPLPHCIMGFYHPDIDTIITPYEIFEGSIR